MLLARRLELIPLPLPDASAGPSAEAERIALQLAGNDGKRHFYLKPEGGDDARIHELLMPRPKYGDASVWGC